jgi:hypothetical protein
MWLNPGALYASVVSDGRNLGNFSIRDCVRKTAVGRSPAPAMHYLGSLPFFLLGLPNVMKKDHHTIQPLRQAGQLFHYP